MRSFSLVLRPVTTRSPIERYAERISTLVKKPSVSPSLECFYPGVLERYSDTQNGAEALNRMAEKQARKEAAAYLLVLTANAQSIDTRESYNTAFNLTHSFVRGLGVTLHGTSLENSERLVGMGTVIHNQSLTGVREALRPSTWPDAHGWANLAIWTDQSATYDLQRRFAERLTDLSPADSFITVENFRRLPDGSTLVDPNYAFDTVQDFVFHPTARPKPTKQAKADGISTEQPSKTYLRRASKVQRRIAAQQL